MDAVTLAAKTPAEDISDLPDHGLVEAMVAARRLASQAQAVELAAVAELARRRRAEDTGSGNRTLSPAEYLHDEVAGALTLTANTADDLIRFATDLTERLPGTLTALGAGEIDYPKARTLWHGTDQLTPPLTAAIEAKVLPKAQTQTTGQIRAKIRRLIKKLDPQTLHRRRTHAERQRGVHLVETDDGTAHLTGTDLPTEAANAAYGRLNAIAAAIKNDGDKRGINQLRADVFLAILRGTLTQPPALQTTTPTDAPIAGTKPPGPYGTAVSQHPKVGDTASGAVTAGRADVDDGAADLIAEAALDKTRTDIPATNHDDTPKLIAATSLCDKSRTDAPAADDDGIADLIAGAAFDKSRVDAAAAGAQPSSAGDRASTYERPRLDSAAAVGWTDADDGIADQIAATARTELSTIIDQGLITEAAARISGSLTDLKTHWCIPDHDQTGYRPPAAIRRLIEHRDRRCCYPNCRRPVRHCDADHSIPYHRGGPTCPCNLAMLCRRHHRLKQTPTWQAHHIWPGVVLWIGPTGHWTITAPADRE